MLLANRDAHLLPLVLAHFPQGVLRIVPVIVCRQDDGQDEGQDDEASHRAHRRRAALFHYFSSSSDTSSSSRSSQTYLLLLLSSSAILRKQNVGSTRVHIPISILLSCFWWCAFMGHFRNS